MAILEFFNDFMAEVSVPGLVLIILVVLLFALQLRYYIRYGRIMKYSTPVSAEPRPISVIAVITDSNYYYLENILPLVLAQKHPQFEVILVDIAEDADFGEALKLAALSDERLNVIHLHSRPQFPIGNKTALNVGIKAAQYENLLLTTPDSTPAGDQWLPLMSSAFDQGDIVLGFCRIEKQKGSSNILARFSNVDAAMRWASAAMRGKAYRGTERNMALTRELYFAKNGFNHLNLNIGEDDLFVQYIARDARVAVMLDPASMVSTTQKGALGWWHYQRLLHSNAFRFYSRRSRLYIGTELWTRALFFTFVIIAAFLLPFEAAIAVLGLLLIRFIVVVTQTVRVSRKLNQPGIWPMILPCDIIQPIYEAILCIRRRTKRTKGLWR